MDRLRMEFYSEENKEKRKWFFRNFEKIHREKIQEEYFNFIKRSQIHINFFEWFGMYTIENNKQNPYITRINMIKK